MAIQDKINDTTYRRIARADPRDRLNVEIGDSKQPDFHPQIKLERWDNEVNISARLIHNERNHKIATDSIENNKITWSGDNLEADFYELEPSEELPEGGYEFDITLKKMPRLNHPDGYAVDFSLETKGIRFAHQPAINKEYRDGWSDEFQTYIIVNETRVREMLTRRELLYRPEYIVDSQAVFCLEEKINYVGDKIYRQGKVGHIPRPKIFDSNGNWTWGALSITGSKRTGRGLMRVVIPKAFIETAVFPIRHAAGATFGYTTQGSSYENIGDDHLKMSKGTTDASGGDVDSVSVYVRGYYTSGNMKGVVADSSYYILTNGVGGVTALPYNTYAWYTSTYSSKPSVSASTDYYACYIADCNTSIAKDTDSGYGRYDGSNSYSSPTDPTDSVSTSARYSIYATYSESTVQKNVSDSGTGSDSVSLSSAATITDSGSGDDSISLSAAISISDSGAGADELTLRVFKTVTDSGIGNDSLLLSVAIAVNDAGAGTDLLSVLAQILLADSGTGVDSVDVEGTNVEKNVSDSGLGSDSISLSTATTVTDSGSGSENVSTAAAITVTDVGTAVDELITLVAAALTDSGVGVDTLSVAANLEASDSGTGSEDAQIAASATVIDSGAGQDSASLSAAINITDAGVTTEVLHVVAEILASDSGTGTDLVSLAGSGITKIVADSGVGVDSVFLQKVAQLVFLCEVAREVVLKTEIANELTFTTEVE